MLTPKYVNLLNTSNKFNSIYQSVWFYRFTAKFIRKGKKSVAEKQIFLAFKEVKRCLRVNPIIIILRGVTIILPLLGVDERVIFRGKRRRMKVRVVPIKLNPRKQLITAMTWIFKLIFSDKKLRRTHIYKNIVHVSAKSFRFRQSKRKIFYDRFQIALSRRETLTELTKTKFIEWYITNFEQLLRKKIATYVKVTNFRIKRIRRKFRASR